MEEINTEKYKHSFDVWYMHKSMIKGVRRKERYIVFENLSDALECFNEETKKFEEENPNFRIIKKVERMNDYGEMYRTKINYRIDGDDDHSGNTIFSVFKFNVLRKKEE
jgi:hypothetical protein